MAAGDMFQGQPQTYGAGQDYSGFLMGILPGLLSMGGGGFTQANPFTQGILNQLGGQQGSAYGNMNDLLSSSLRNFNPQNFLAQFMNNAGGLGALAQGSQVGQDALMKQAGAVGQNAMQDVASQFAGLGSLYSGGAAQEATKAFAQPMFQAMSQGSAQQNQLLNNLFGGAMGGLQQGNLGQLNAGVQGAGQYGQLSGVLGDILGRMGTPMMMANPTLLQQLEGLLGSAGSAAGGVASLASAGMI